MKNYQKALLSLILPLMFSALNSCGDETDGAGMFTKETIGSVQTSSSEFITFAKDDTRGYDSRMIFVTENQTGSTDLKTYLFQSVSGSRIDETVTVAGSISDWGYPGSEIIDSSDCHSNPDKPYVLLKDQAGQMIFLDSYRQKTFVFGSYNFGIFWMDDTGGTKTTGQALLINGGVATDDFGVKTLTAVTSLSFWDYDSTGSPEWKEIKNVFDNMPGKDQYFTGASNIVIKKWVGENTSEYGSTLVLIDKDSKIRYLRTGDIKFYDNYRFSDVTASFINNFVTYGMKIRSFNYYVKSNSVEQFSHFCVIAQAENDSSKYNLYSFQPFGKYDDVPSVDDVYPGTCSIVSFIRTDSATLTRHIPWISYHSSRSALSVAGFNSETESFDSFVLDESPEGWLFANKVNSIARAASSIEEIIVFYNDNENLKIAACNDNYKCGFFSSR